MWAACIPLHSNGRYGSTRVGVSGPKEDDEVGEQRHARGTLGGTQYRKKNWQIPKYRVKNRRNTDTAYIFGLAYLKLYPSRVFISSIYAPAINLSRCEETWDDLELIGTTIEKDVLPISSQIICQKLGNHLLLIESLKNTDVH